jgi:hypothetical protein
MAVKQKCFRALKKTKKRNSPPRMLNAPVGCGEKTKQLVGTIALPRGVFIPLLQERARKRRRLKIYILVPSHQAAGENRKPGNNARTNDYALYI